MQIKRRDPSRSCSPKGLDGARMPPGSALQVAVERRADIPHQQPAVLRDLDGQAVAFHQPVAGQGIDGGKLGCEVRFLVRGGDSGEIDRKIAHEAFNDAPAQAVVVGQGHAPHRGEPAVRGRLAIGDGARSILDIALRQRSDGGGSEADEGGRVVGGVPLEVPVQPALALAQDERIIRLRKMVDADRK